MESLRGRAVSEISVNPITVNPSDPVSKVVGSMRERGAYEVFVVDRDKIGAVIARDLLTATHIATRKASTLVLKMPRLSPNSTIGEAARLMVNYRIRALPVVADDKLVGEVNAIAILRAMREVNLGETQKVSSIMTSAPITIRANDNAAKARELMVRRKIDHLPVVGDGKLIGIVTSNDLINRMIPPEGVGAESMVHKATRRLDYGVKDMMDSVPLTVRPSDPLPKVLNDILSQRKTYAVVILFDEIQGIVTHRDYMKLVAAPEEKSSIPTFIVGLPEDPFEAETAKIKFTKTVQQLGRVFPDIVEARSVIKTKSTRPEKERRRYEVKVTLATPRESYSFSEVGWELPAIYDELVDKMKRLMTKKVPARKPERRRVAASP